MGSPASGWRCVLRHALVLEAIPPSHRLVLLLCTGFLFSGPGWCGRLQPFSFSYVFLRDVDTLWVNSVFLSLLIANEGLHWWLFLFRYSHPYWGLSRRIHTSSLGLSELLVAGGHALPGLSLFFTSGLSSPGLLGCLAMCLR